MSPFLNRLLHRALKWSGPLLLLFFAAYRCVDWGTERWWFESLGYGAQFSRLFWWRAGAFLLGSAVFALWVGLNAHLAWRNASRISVPLAFFEMDDERRLIPLEDKLHLDRYRRRATFFVVALLTWLAGLNCDSRYALLLRAVHAGNTGVTDKASGLDLGFFLFQLPFWQWLGHFCFYAIFASLVLVVGIYLYEELIGPAAYAPRIHAAFAKHLAILWMVLLLWKGADCLLAIPETYVTGGNVATRVFDSLDMTLGWTSSGLFALATPLFAVFSGLAIARHPRAQTFLIGMGWMLGATAIPLLLPLMMGRSLQDRHWQEALNRHVTSTRRAWGLDQVQRRKIKLDSRADFHDVGDGDFSISGLQVALWPAASAVDAMNARLQARGSSARVQNVWLEGKGATLAYCGIGLPDSPSSSLDWRERHSRSASVGLNSAVLLKISANRTQYDSGPVFNLDAPVPMLFGPVDTVDSGQNRQADMGSGGVAPDGGATVQDDARWVIARATDRAVGVPINSWPQKLPLAVRFFDPGLVSSEVGSGDLALWHRGAADRCSQIAPFIDWQDEARPVLTSDTSGNKRMKWLVSGLVWSQDYPDSAASALSVTAPNGANYGREAAVGVVDAQSGKVSLFCLDEDEPFMALYRRVFPDLFAPLTDLSPDLRAQLRPCPALLNAQALVWGRYHGEDLPNWVGQKDNWRPLLTSVENDETTLRPFSNPEKGDWQALAYTPSIGQAGENSSSPGLSGILGIDQSDFAVNGGKLRFVEWTGDDMIPLPSNAAEPSGYGNPYINPMQMIINIVPRFDSNGTARGILVSNSTILDRDSKGTSTPTIPRAMTPEVTPTASSEAPVAGGQIKLLVKLSLLGSGDDLKKLLAKPQNQSNKALGLARSAWANLLAARKQGDWSGVALAEKELGSALGTP